jgi:hypothetical protein
MIGDFRAFLDSAMTEAELTKIRHHTRTRRVLEDSASVDRLEAMLGCIIAPQKRGPKPRNRAS